LIRDNPYTNFVDVLYDMEVNPAFDATSIDILIRMGYFQEFGSAGKLLKVFHEFRSGSSRFSKTHIAQTQQKRLAILRQLADELSDEEIPVVEQVRFEIGHYGTVLSVFPDHRGQFAVLDVDDRYSPKLRLYNLSTGTVGVMKVNTTFLLTQRHNPTSASNAPDGLWRQRGNGLA